MMRDLQSTWRQEKKRSITGASVAEAVQEEKKSVRKEKINPPSDLVKPTTPTKKRKRTVAQKNKPAPTVRKHDASPAKAPISAPSLKPALPAITALNLQVGVAHISSVDEGLARLVSTYGSPHSLILSTTSTFGTLARSIVSQQLSTKAAATIYARFVSACKCEPPEEISPAAVLATPRESLKASGLSGSKVKYLLNLASRYADSRLSCETIRAMNEEELVTNLTAISGIGLWTADMFAMFSMGRPDMLPVGDLGIRKGFAAHFDLKKLPDAAQMEELSERWRPWRSIGCYYMWRLCEEQKHLVVRGRNSASLAAARESPAPQG